MRILLHFLLYTAFLHAAFAETQQRLQIWPDSVPGQQEPKAAHVFSENTSGNTTRISQVTDPALIVYEADPANKNGAAVIVCPGGGYRILAIDKEGYEVAEWLSGLGYTAFVLEYRVPQNRLGALQDAQRAIRMVRGRSQEFGIDPLKVGILGFSAGGSLSARASTRYAESLYEPLDTFDRLSARPDFSILIYPAYLDQGPNGSLTPELTLDKETPPMFLFVAGDDRFVSSSLVLGSALSAQKVPFELHVVPSGGHGFGMRPGNRAAELWPELCRDWMDIEVLK